MKELDRIKAHYSDRRSKDLDAEYGSFSTYNSKKRLERDSVLLKILEQKFTSVKELRVLEIGAGKGGNLELFLGLGVPPEKIYVNDLLEENRAYLKKYLPVENIHIGNAADLNFNHKFDIVFQSLVLTSVLDSELRKEICSRMIKCCSEKGIILWYDFAFNNPNNDSVRGIGQSEIRDLFIEAAIIDHYRVTLAPPIGRRVGRLYDIFNAIPFLRTHIVASIIM